MFFSVGLPASASTVVFQRPAGDAIVDGSGLAVFTPDFRAVVGLDRRGRQRWRRKLQGDARGVQRLMTVGDQLAAVTGDTVHLLDGANGRRGPKIKTGFFSAVNRPGCGLDETPGACAVRCQCNFQVVDCKTGAAIGPRFRLPIFEELSADGGPWSGCRGDAGELVAATPTVVVAVTPKLEEPRGKFFTPRVLRGIARKTGKTLWMSEVPVSSVSFSGVSGDKRTCWLSGYDGLFVAFDCATGTERWRATHRASKGSPAFVTSLADGTAVLVRDGDFVRLKRLDTGATAWSLHAPREAVRVDGDRRPQTVAADAVRVVSVTDGATRVSFKLPSPKRATLVVDPAGGWVVGFDGGVIRVSSAGLEMARREVADAGEILVGDSLVAVHTRTGLTILDGPSLALGLVRGDPGEQILAVEGVLGKRRVALFKNGKRPWDKTDPETFGEVIVLQIP